MVNQTPRSSLLRRSSHFGYEGRKLRGIRRGRINEKPWWPAELLAKVLDTTVKIPGTHPLFGTLSVARTDPRSRRHAGQSHRDRREALGRDRPVSSR